MILSVEIYNLYCIYEFYYVTVMIDSSLSIVKLGNSPLYPDFGNFLRRPVKTS